MNKRIFKGPVVAARRRNLSPFEEEQRSDDERNLQPQNGCMTDAAARQQLRHVSSDTIRERMKDYVLPTAKAKVDA